MNTAQVIPFDFEKQQVRVTVVDGDPWFVAADVCKAIGIANTSQALQALDDDERSMFNIGRQGNANIISESGLFTLILRSREATTPGTPQHRFRKWVTAEVLPAIRRTGQYRDSSNKMATLVDELIGMTEVHVIKGLIRDKAKVVLLDKRRSFQQTMHNRLHTRFNVPRIELIPAQQFEAACNFIAAYALEGEWLEAERPEQEQDRMNIHWPAQRWIDESPSDETREAMTFGHGNGRIYIAARMLHGRDQPSPTLDALSELESNGYNVEACRLEVLAMRWHLEQFQYELDCTAECIDLLRHKGVRYVLGANKPTRA